MNYQKSLLACTLAAATLASAAVLAQEEPFEGSIGFGYVGTTGNTDTTTVNAEILAIIRAGQWTNTAKFQAMAAQEDSLTQAERYYFEDKSDYNLDEMQYVFGRGTYTDDRYSGFDYQASIAAGYGRHLIRRDNFGLEAFGGAGYRENSIIDENAEGEFIYIVGENMSWQISESSSVIQSLTSDIGDDLSVSRFELGLVSNIMNRIATKIAFQARHTSDVPLGNKKTDTQTSVSLVYGF